MIQPEAHAASARTIWKYAFLLSAAFLLVTLWNFGMQRDIGHHILDVSYVGSRGTHLFINEQINPGVNNVRLNPARGGITDRTNGGICVSGACRTRTRRSDTAGRCR